MNPAVARGHEIVVVDVDRVEPDVVLGCFKRAFGLRNPFRGGPQPRICGIDRLLALVEQFLRRITTLQQGLGALQFLRRQRLLRTLLFQIGIGLVNRPLRLLHLRLRLLERLLDIPGVHAGNHLPCGHHVADFGVQFRDPARKFGVNIDLVGLKPAVAKADPEGQLRLRVFPPIETASPGCRKQDKQQQRASQPPPAANSLKSDRYRQLFAGDGGAETLVRGPWFRAFAVMFRRILVNVR